MFLEKTELLIPFRVKSISLLGCFIDLFMAFKHLHIWVTFAYFLRKLIALQEENGSMTAYTQNAARK